MITSDKAYQNLEIKRGYNENDILGGKDIYSGKTPDNVLDLTEKLKKSKEDNEKE